MSEFREFRDGVIEQLSTLEDWKDVFRSVLLDNDWQILEEDGDDMFFIPPATEPIGNDEFYEVCRARFTDTNVLFTPLIYATDQAPEYPAMWGVRLMGTTANSKTIIINGISITLDNNEGPSGFDNKRSLMVSKIEASEELAAVVDRIELDRFAEEDFVIIGKPGAEVTVTASTNTRVTELARSFVNDKYIESTVLAGGRGLGNNSITLIQGMAYYFSIYDRTITLATKTTQQFYGPINISWSDNSVALERSRHGGAPIELCVVHTGTGTEVSLNNNIKRLAPLTRNFTISHRNGNVFATSRGGTTFGRDAMDSNWPDVRSVEVDMVTGRTPYAATLAPDYWPLHRKYILGTGSYDHHRTSRPQFFSGGGIDYGVVTTDNPYYDLMRLLLKLPSTVFRGYIPCVLHMQGNPHDYISNQVTIDDVYAEYPNVHFLINDSSSETVHVVPNGGIIGVVVSDTGSTIAIDASSTEVPEEGTLVVGGEVILYGEYQGGVFSSLTRGALGTAEATQASGSRVHSANWYVKINDGALLMGTKGPL